MAFEKKKPSLDEASARIRTFCNFRERSHREVKDKLYGMGLYKSEVDRLLTQLIEEDLLNEERFARGFIRGHFYQKKWGWRKIESALQQQGIHRNLMNAARTEIDAEDYRKTALELAGKKWLQFKSDDNSMRKAKVYRFLTGKGYEAELVTELVRQIGASAP